MIALSLNAPENALPVFHSQDSTHRTMHGPNHVRKTGEGCFKAQYKGQPMFPGCLASPGTFRGDSDPERRYFWYTWGGVRCRARERPSIPLTKRGHLTWWESLQPGVRGPGFELVLPPTRCVTFQEIIYFPKHCFPNS